LPTHVLSLSRETAPAPASDLGRPICGGIWVEEGAVTCDAQTLTRGDGVFFTGASRVGFLQPGSSVLRFGLHRQAPGPAIRALLASAPIDITEAQVLVRMDRVRFPPGAIAYRHVHPGAGFRYLSDGQLEVAADDHVQQVQRGQFWFEAAHSPVRATASSDAPFSQFIRLMILPVAYAGLPTIDILSAQDKAKPRLQVTHRFFDQIVTLDQLGDQSG